MRDAYDFNPGDPVSDARRASWPVTFRCRRRRPALVRALALATLAGLYCCPAPAQVYIPGHEFAPRASVEANAATATPTLSESDSLTEPARWQNGGYAVGVGCRSNGQIPPPPRTDPVFAICPGSVDSAHAGIDVHAGRIRIGTDAAGTGVSSASAEIRDYVVVDGPAATVPVTWTFNVEGNLRRSLPARNDFTGTHSVSTDLDTWVQVGGIFTENRDDDLGLGIHTSASGSHEPDQPRRYFSLDRVAPTWDSGDPGDTYGGDLAHSFAGMRNVSRSHTDESMSAILYPSPVAPLPPSITVELPTGTLLPVVIGAHSVSQCYTPGGGCSAEADFGNTIYIIASVPSGYRLSSQGGFSYTGQTAPPSSNPGTLQFAEAEGSVNENAGTITLQITRTGGATGEVTARVGTRTTGTATAGSDFTAIDVPVVFADGDSTPKSVSLSILDDSVNELVETIVVELTEVTGGATLGAISTSTISIRDNDPLVTLPPATGSSSGGGALGLTVLAALLALLLVRRPAGSQPSCKQMPDQKARSGGRRHLQLAGQDAPAAIEGPQRFGRLPRGQQAFDQAPIQRFA